MVTCTQVNAAFLSKLSTEVGDSLKKPTEGFLGHAVRKEPFKQFSPGLANSRYNELFSGSNHEFIISGFHCVEIFVFLFTVLMNIKANRLSRVCTLLLFSF